MDRKAVGHICALITNMIWSSTFISTKVLLRDFSPVEILFYRFLLGYLFLWILRPKLLRTDSWRTEVCFAGCGFFGIFLNYFCENSALLYTNASNVSVIVSASPFCVGILAYFLLKEKWKRFFGVGFVFAIVGIAMISFDGMEGASFHWVGDLISVAAALTWAVYGIFSDKVNAKGYDVILVSRRMFFYGLIFVGTAYAAEGGHHSIELLCEPVYLGNLLYLGLCACALAFVIWNYAVKVLGAVVSNVYVYLLPVFTIILSVLILHERLSAASVAGMALTLAGTAISQIE